LTAFALVALGGRARPVLNAIEYVSQVFFAIMRIVVKAAPLGAFGAMAFTVGSYGLASLGKLLALMCGFYLTAAVFVVVVLGGIARWCGVSIFRLLAYLKDELLLVLGTSSSETALPALIEKMERLGCPRSTVGVVVPTGYSFNLDGTNIYMSLAALFIAQATNTPLSFGDQLLLMAVAILSSKGAAGVTGSGFIVLAATLSVLPTVPVAGMALILGVDRFMSECRSLTNFIGNAVATIVVARWEKALDPAQLRAALANRVNELDEADSDALQIEERSEPA
ncbi:MAG: cation:dicarboxylase symporter family transporter, partial [Allosphingosinicella sp.]